MEIKFKKRFQKDFKKLLQKIKDKFYERLEVFTNNKFDIVLNNHSVDKVFSDCRSINITGNYRAIFKDDG